MARIFEVWDTNTMSVVERFRGFEGVIYDHALSRAATHGLLAVASTASFITVSDASANLPLPLSPLISEFLCPAPARSLLRVATLTMHM